MPADAGAALWPIDGVGLWHEPRRAPYDAPRRALFVDRDGTLIEHVHYLRDPRQVRLIAAAAHALARANALGIPVVMVTNQSGIGRGYYGWADFAAVQAALDRLLAQAGARLDGLYACPHPPRTGATQPEPHGRKPDPGMLLAAARDLNLDLGASWIAGDALCDIEAGKRAGLARGILVPSGLGARDAAAARELADAGYAVETAGFESLGGALAPLAPQRRKSC